MAASTTRGSDDTLLLIDSQNSFWIFARWAENIFLNESIQEILKFTSIVCSIDNVAIILRITIDLGA